MSGSQRDTSTGNSPARLGRTRALFLLFALSTLFALVLIGVAEATLRLLGGASGASKQESLPPWMDRDTFELWQQWAERTEIPLAELASMGWDADPVLRWKLRPNLSMDARNIFIDPAIEGASRWQLVTNDRGFRTPKFETAKRPGTLRIVTLGDSNTMGWLLEDPDTYPRRLEARLSNALGRQVEVINLGVGGYTSFSALHLFREVALSLEPDAIVLSVGANDPQNMHTSDAAYEPPDTSGTFHGIRQVLGGLRLTTALRSLLPPPARVARVSPVEYGENLSAIFAEATSRSIPTVFSRICCCASEYQSQLNQSAARYRVPLIDAHKTLQLASRSAAAMAEYREKFETVASWYSPGELKQKPWLLFYFRDRCHLNPLGADILADRLAQQLSSMLDEK